jgi:arylsulfatase
MKRRRVIGNSTHRVKPAGEGKIKRTFFRHGLEPFEIGRDSITAVSPDYKAPFAFTGRIEKTTFELTKK